MTFAIVSKTFYRDFWYHHWNLLKERLPPGAVMVLMMMIRTAVTTEMLLTALLFDFL